MHDFEYEAPRSLDNAIQLLAKHNGSAKPLAGGTDLIDHVRTQRVTPDLLIDVKQIPALNVLEVTADGLRLGAAVPCYRIYENDTIVRDYTALADSCRIIGGIQIQSRASVGGNLCNSGPAADSIPPLIALGAIAVIAGPAGTRDVAAEDFCTAPGQNVLAPGELLVELKFPSRPARSGSHYRRFIPRNEMDIAVVGVGVSVELDENCDTFVSARIALAAVAPTPLFVAEVGNQLAGRPVNNESIKQAAQTARDSISPIDDMRGTKQFRLHLTGVLTERVLKAAVERAKANRERSR